MCDKVKTSAAQECSAEINAIVVLLGFPMLRTTVNNNMLFIQHRYYLNGKLWCAINDCLDNYGVTLVLDVPVSTGMFAALRSFEPAWQELDIATLGIKGLSGLYVIRTPQ